MDKEEWLTTCAARFETRAGLNLELARSFAEASLEVVDGDLTENPEDAADEEMSCWTDDGDNF